MCNAGVALPRAVTVGDAFACGVEGFPRDTRRVINPRLFGFGIATGRLPLLNDVATCLSQPSENLVKLLLALHFNSQMVEPRLALWSRWRN